VVVDNKVHSKEPCVDDGMDRKDRVICVGSDDCYWDDDDGGDG